MKKVIDRVLMGYVIQIPFIIVVVLLAFIWRSLDSFYNQFFFEPVFGREFSGAGVLMSVFLAFVLGYIAETEKGWALMSRVLNVMPLARGVTSMVEQWKLLRELAKTQGFILAPYYPGRFWPAVVTNTLAVEGGTHLITVVFFDLPLPKPFSLEEGERIYTKLSFSEAAIYMASFGFGFRLFGRKLQIQTLGEYVRRGSWLP
ncbi:MAG: hypothetical protein HYW90_02675 [Candidatus Sungbacteria bacterium]|nr:hypothetical protein [Candidatus Sungbacteria bacterium]